jgi:predicted transcriptional regulator
MNSSTQAHSNPEAHPQEHDPAGLGELEQTVLRMVWQSRQATAERVREQLQDQGREDGRSVAGRAVQRIVDRFCGGSVEALLVGMVNADVLSEDELQRLAAKIARAKSKAGKSK